MPPRKKQQTLLEFTSSPSSVKHSSPLKRRNAPIEIDSEDVSDSDPGRIQFERDVIEIQDSDQQQSDAEEAGKASVHSRRSARIQKSRKSPLVVSGGTSSSASSAESEVVPKKRSGGNKRSSDHVINSDESDKEPPRKRRLVKGKRPESPALAEEEEDDQYLIQEVDEDRILDTRLRDRSKKTAFARNLERLQRRRRGQLSASEGDDDEEEDSDSSSPAHAGPSKLLRGARPTITTLDEEEETQDDVSVDEHENEKDFIVEDDGGEEMPELPTMFSMGTFQDLSHHFKVICQLFVHLAVKQPHKRRSFMKSEMKKNYFSVPLAIARRKLSGMKDSLVVSSIWKPDFKTPLETFPDFRLEQLDFSIPLCDACHLGNRVAMLRGVVTGQEYDRLTFESLGEANAESNEERPREADWNLGRFCAARAQVFHTFTHWEYILYHALRGEVERLREASSPGNGDRRGKRFFLPATNGAPPPDDLDDADGIMDWLDGRGIINGQWLRLKEMMERAHKLEAKSKEAEDDIDIG